jgi:TctA family transporter
LLFPVFSGFFGASIIFTQLKNKTSFPEQSSDEIKIKKGSFASSVFGGTSAGVLSGFLPGVGSSQMGTIATFQKKDENFIATMGAITASNIFLSILCLWFIDRTRSGAAVILQNVLPEISLTWVLFMSVAALISVSLSIIIIIFITRKFSVFMKNINYSVLNKIILLFIIFMILITTGAIGVFLFVTCLSIGIYANMSGIKRGLMMCVLIIPTILFFIRL